MSKPSAKTLVPVIILLALCVLLACVLTRVLTLKSQTEAAQEVILPVHATSVPLRTAVPATPTPAPTVAPVLANAQTELSARPYPFWSEGGLWKGSFYRSPTLSVNLTVTNDAKTFGRRVIYYVADIHVADVTQIRTEAYSGSFKKARHGEVEEMADRVNALVAISGDYCGFHNNSLVIRNGEVFRTALNSNDICVLYRNGEMETIRAADVRIDSILEKEPWQAWEFGPALLDENGRARTSFPESTISERNPRCCIGYAEPGHYYFVVVDGRQKTSHGLTLPELARLMESLGCTVAFNLDGGASAHMYWKNGILNQPSNGGRSMSDIIYIAKESYRASYFYCGKGGRSE